VSNSEEGISGKVAPLKVTNSVMCNVLKREFLSASDYSGSILGERDLGAHPPPSQSSELFDHSGTGQKHSSTGKRRVGSQPLVPPLPCKREASDCR
jgi:hypothetical protein